MRHLALAAFSVLLASCGFSDLEGDTPPPPPPPSADPVTPPNPVVPAAPAAILSSSAPPGLVGAYELDWMETAGESRSEMPAALLRQLPGCFWGRWFIEFRPDGTMRFQNEVLCDDPFRLQGEGYGVCVAEANTEVWWAEGRFRLPVAVRATSQMHLFHPTRGGMDRFRANCNIRFSAMEGRLTEIQPGAAPNRPAAVTIDAGALRYHLVAVPDSEIEVPYGTLIERHRSGR